MRDERGDPNLDQARCDAVDRDLALGLNVAYQDEDLDSESSFDASIFRFRPSLSFPISENGRLNTFYEIERINIRAEAVPQRPARSPDL